MAPQIIVIVYLFLVLLIASHYHGKPRTGNYNLWGSFAFSIIVLLLLFWGGFFDVWIK